MGPMGAFSLLEQNSLGLKLVPLSIRELLYLEDSPCDIYGLNHGLYELILKKSAFLNNVILKDLIKRGQTKLFVYRTDHQLIVERQQKNLREITRSLSIGDPVEKGKKQLSLLTINMRFLYENPTDDDALDLQIQSVKNLAYFLLDNHTIHEKLYQEYIKQKHHFVFAQPLLSSLFLIGLLRMSRLFSDKEMENLFLTSFFKDIGMSAIPTEKYDEENLSEEDKKLLARHPDLSVQILTGRLPVTPNHLRIIENHHSFSKLTKGLDIISESNNLVVSGFETIIISVMDIISAMIAGRPYQEATTLFESLDMVRILIADQYPQEFKLIVTYFKNFFSRSMGHKKN